MIAAYRRMHPEAQAMLLFGILMAYVLATVAAVRFDPPLNHSLWFGVPAALMLAVILATLFERLIAMLNAN